MMVSLLLHLVLIACLFLIPMLPSRTEPIPVYTVDLVGGEKIGAAKLATELAPPPKQAAKISKQKKSARPEPKREVKKEKPEKEEKVKTKPVEKKIGGGRKDRPQRENQAGAGKAKPANDTKKNKRDGKE